MIFVLLKKEEEIEDSYWNTNERRVGFCRKAYLGIVYKENVVFVMFVKSFTVFNRLKE